MSLDYLSVQVLRGVMMGTLSLWVVIFLLGHRIFGQPSRRQERLNTEFQPSPLRPWLGVMVFYLVLGYIWGYLVDLIPSGERHEWWLQISFLSDVLVVPLVVVVAAKLLRLEYMHGLRIVLNFAPFIMLLVLRVCVDSFAIMYVCLAYTLLYLAVALWLMVHYALRYEARLHDQYSSLYGRSIQWMLIIPVLVLLQIIVFLFRSYHHELVSLQVTYYLLSLVNLCFIFSRVYCMILTEEDSSPVDVLTDTPVDTSATPEEETDTDDRNREFIALLQSRCVDTLLYTREDLTRDELARALGMSHSTLTLRLRSALDQSFYEYINDLRITRATVLLDEGELSAKQIAFEVGYQYYSTFARAFQARYGCVPSEYKSSSPPPIKCAHRRQK